MSGRWHETHVVDPQTELKPAKSLGGVDSLASSVENSFELNSS